MKSNLDLEIQNSIPTVNKWLVLVTAEHENNKERTHHNASHQYPANPSPYGGRVWALSGVSCAALETDNVIRSTASCFSTTPHWNHFSTGRAFSSKYFHDYLSTDICAQPSGAPWNDGGRSFSTKERLSVCIRETRKVAIFVEKGVNFALFK